MKKTLLAVIVGVLFPASFLYVMGQSQVSPVPVTGQRTMDNSQPVVVASDQSAIPTTPAAGTTTNINIGSSGGTAVVSAGLAGALAIGGTVADGAASGATYPVVIGGVDGSGNVQRVLTDTGGAIQVDVESVPANQSVNLTQVNGATAQTAVGTSTGAQRVAALIHDGTDVALVTAAGALNSDLTTVAGTALSTGNGVAGAGTPRVAIASDNTAFTVNVGTFPDNEPFNVAQINGVTPLMGNGVTGTGSLRVTLASDTSSNTNNFNTNTAQINGVAPTMGNGTSGTGVQRVTIASDSTGQVTLATGANTIGALTANQSVNAAQMAGTATSVNNGTADAGTQRVTLASDSTGQVALATGANTIGALTANQSVNVAQIAGTATVTAGVAGLQAVGGAAASGASASGNPVQIGLVYNTTRPTLTTGQVVQAQSTSDGLFEVAQTPTIDGAVALSTAFTSTLGDTVFNVKTSQGNLYGYQAFNAHTAVCFVQIFNVPAASVNLGTTVPTLSIGIPTVNEAQKQSTMPILYSADGISAASTTTATGNTACTSVTVANFLFR